MVRIPISCHQCVAETDSPRLYFAEVRDNGLYHFRCPSGHETVICLGIQKFELLFHLGAHAIVDGYYREAVASFKSSLERFYEFYIQVICEKRGISEDVFDSAWKNVSAQSERQLGAFYFLYLIENSGVPPSLSRKHDEFRNDVIHKGKFPTKEEAFDYGQAVMDVAAPILKQLKESDAEHVRNINFRNVQKMQKCVKGNPFLVNTSICLTMDILCERPKPLLQEKLDYIELENSVTLKLGKDEDGLREFFYEQCRNFRVRLPDGSLGLSLEAAAKEKAMSRSTCNPVKDLE